MNGLSEPAVQFLDRLGERDRSGALALVGALIAAGASLVDVIGDVLAPAQRRVGELWESGEWTVSQEHAATAIVEEVLAALASANPSSESRGRLVLACCEHEWHSLPARMLGDVLRTHGWDVTFLGASTAADDLGEFLRTVDPIALVASCSVSMNLPGAARLIDAAHASGYRVLVGGAALTAERAGALGADGWAALIADTDAILDQWRDHPAAPRSVARAGALPAAAITSAQTRLVELAMSELRIRIPAMERFNERQVSRTRADLGFIVGFAAAAVLVSDDSVFHDFTDWLDGILVRVGHPGVLAISLQVLASVSDDHHRLAELLLRGSDRLISRTS